LTGETGNERAWIQRSVDGGATWLANPIPLDLGFPPVVYGAMATLDREGSQLVACWQAQSQTTTSKRDVAASGSTDGGLTWSPPRRIGLGTSGVSDSSSFDAALLAGTLHVVWSENRDALGYRQLFAARSTDFGATFTEQEVGGFEGGWLPEIAGDGENLVVGYEGGFSAQQSSAIASTDGGATWTPEIVLVEPAGAGFLPTHLAYDAPTESVATLQLRGGTLSASGFSLCDDGGVVVRNAGTNPSSLQAGAAILGATWTATVDLSLTGHALATLVAFLTPAQFPLPGGQTVLVNPFDPSGEILQLAPAGGSPATFQVPVPNLPSVCGLTVSAQAVHFGGVTPFALSNALDVTAAAL